MNTTFNPTLSQVVAKNIGSTTVKPKQNNNIEQKQMTEAYSSNYSSAVRSMALAKINTAKPTAKTEEINYTEGINCKVVKETTADETNTWGKEEMGYDNPPYLPKTKVQQIELEEDTTFVRVYDGVNSGMYGGWVMKASDVGGLTSEQIKDKFALPQTPCKMCDVTLQKGTQMRTGLCNPLEGWGKGGGVQFDLMGQRVGEFGNERAIPDI